MRKILTICIIFQLVACRDEHSGSSETELLKLRITRLEQRIDSLINPSKGVNATSFDSLHQKNSFIDVSVRCKAIAKNGAQCKRKAKTNGYCWQHQ
jgi:hypothetical protein